MSHHTSHPLLVRVDQRIEADAAKEAPFRNHLGGSMIGKECERELVYNFRWAKKPNFKARMLRLFSRGHSEEFRFVSYLRGANIEVREYSERLFWHAESDCYFTVLWDDETGAEEAFIAGCDDVTGIEKHVVHAGKKDDVKLTQWRISDVDGHFGGSLDGEGVAPFPISVDDMPGTIPVGEKFLLEFKTHNTKSFCKLVVDKVKKAKPVHWAQMQVYMHKRDLKWAVYMAVNKNDDDLYIEVISYDPAEGPKLLERAERVIRARSLPERIGKHPSWHDCKFCDYAGPCHMGEPINKSCRSCKFSAAIPDGKWRCDKWNAIIPSDAIPQGCDNYSVITD